ncbi:MAG: lactate utilization protein, partial [Christensenellaceae bacterium]|nr:lactate utilization protein [Christensenellaceae bacterium]
MEIKNLTDILENKGFKTYFTETTEDALRLLTGLIGKDDTVGAGGSATLDEIGIGKSLKERGNKVFIRKLMPDVNPDEVMRNAVFADWFLTSTNALTENGEFVNTDGNCNRIAAQLYGGKNTVFVLGV